VTLRLRQMKTLQQATFVHASVQNDFTPRQPRDDPLSANREQGGSPRFTMATT